MLEEAIITCPYCGQAISVLIDCSAGDGRYTEDCSICCQPIELVVTVTPDAALASVAASPENR